jgi:hypothetical protein
LDKRVIFCFVFCPRLSFLRQAAAAVKAERSEPAAPGSLDGGEDLPDPKSAGKRN